MAKNYSRTLVACYLGFITQAIAANFAPLLFLSFNRGYGIPLGKIALIPAVFFMTQLVVDIVCAQVVDRIGYRKCVVASEVCSAAGFVMLAFLPDLFAEPFAGIVASVVVYAIGSGLIEVLVSPIVEACPFGRKEAAMSLLHSFYCWGTVGVIVLSTLFFKVFGIQSWKVLACLWAVLPLVNVFNFAACPIEHPAGGEKGMGLFELLRTPLFYLAVVLMVCAGASELSMAQWASAFAEGALGLSKTAGDLAGPCLFAAAMGMSRVFFGKFGGRISLVAFMVASGLVCVLSYLLASLSAAPILGLAGCILGGFSVGIMWPGTISVCSPRIPRGGTAFFAMLAMAGDLGGSVGPALVGEVSQAAGDNLRRGLLAGGIFPVVLVASLVLLACAERRKRRGLV